MTDATPTEKTAMDKLREMTAKAQQNEIIDKVEKLSLFDSKKASSRETTGTADRGTMKPVDGGYMVSGRSIGAE